MFSLCGEAGAVQYQHHLEDATQMAWKCLSNKKPERNRLSLKSKVLQTNLCLPWNSPGSFSCFSPLSYAPSAPSPNERHANLGVFTARFRLALL